MTRVIIIDDEKDWTEVLKDFLEIKEIEVIAIGNNGKDAVELCINDPPDFLLLDISMPKFDGFYALEKLKELNIPTKIIILTGLLTDENQSKMKKYNVLTTFIKPINPNLIVDYIKN